MILEAPPGFEPGMEVLQTSALPLGDGARQFCAAGTKKPAEAGSRKWEMERETGFEPATSTLARSHSTTELFPLATTVKGTTRICPNQAERQAVDASPVVESPPCLAQHVRGF